MRRFLLATVLLLPLASAAQPASGPERVRISAREPLPPLLLSTGVTALGAGLTAVIYRWDGRRGLGDPGTMALVATVALAPSVGNLWYGHMSDAALGLALRAAGAGALLYSLSGYDLYDSPEGFLLLAGGGVVAIAAGLGVDAVTQLRNGPTVRVRPEGAGLALTVSL